MADYFRVSPKFWVKARSWSERDQRVALYLLTNKHRHTEGLYHLPTGYAATDLDLAPRHVDQAFAALEERSFMAYDQETSVVFIRKALKYQAPATGGQITGAIRRLAALPPTCHWDAFLQAAECHAPKLWDAIRVAFECHPGAYVRAHAASSSSSISSSEGGGSAPARAREAEANGADPPT